MKLLLVILSIILSVNCIGQYKLFNWPYIKDPTPHYISIYSGLAGKTLNQLEFGVGFNVPKITGSGTSIYSTTHYDTIPPSKRNIGFSFVGPMATYRMDRTTNLQAFTFGVSLKSFINLGLDFVTFKKLDKLQYSIKPLVGLYIFHVNLEYGYNFFLNKGIQGLKNSEFRVGLNLPVINLTKTNK